MTVSDLFVRFPQIAPVFKDEPDVHALVETWGDLLLGAREPGNCATDYDAGNHYYLKIVAPMVHVTMGLANKETVLEKIRGHVAGRKSDPDGYPLSLLPQDVAETERRRCD